ncbi:hypothetical protein ACHAXM_011207 [Skeletonema potamos]|jgi:NifB/MoaA-like Fe-S oxidoreductase
MNASIKNSNNSIATDAAAVKGLSYYWNLTSISNEKQTQISKVEQALRRYLREFDGKKKDFKVVEPLFDNLFHCDFTQLTSWGDRIDAFDTRKLHATYIKQGMKARLIRFRRAGVNAFEVRIELAKNNFNSGGIRIHKRINVSEDKIESAIDTSLASMGAEDRFIFLDELRLNRHYCHDLSVAVQSNLSNPSYNLPLAAAN